MQSENQEKNSLRRLVITVRTFFNNNGNISDHDLSIALNSMGINTSPVTVAHDLTNPKIAQLWGKHVYEVIQDLRKKNKHVGRPRKNHK